MKKKENLFVGQRAFIEVNNIFNNEPDNIIHEFEVVEANNTNAYLVEVLHLKSDIKKEIRYKVNQRNHEVSCPIKLTGYKFTLWLSKEEYEAHAQYSKELNKFLKLAHEKVDKLNLEELKEFVNL